MVEVPAPDAEAAEADLREGYAIAGQEYAAGQGVFGGVVRRECGRRTAVQAARHGLFRTSEAAAASDD